MRKKVLRIFASILLVCIVLVVGRICLMRMLYRPRSYYDLKPVQEIGLFQELEIESGSCTFEVPPSVRSLVQPFLRSVTNWYGECVLSKAVTADILQKYNWEAWSISENVWENAKETRQSIAYTHMFMFEFDNLKNQYINKSFLVSYDFDLAQDNSHRIGQLYSYLDIDTRTLFFYYSSS